MKSLCLNVPIGTRAEAFLSIVWESTHNLDNTNYEEFRLLLQTSIAIILISVKIYFEIHFKQ